MRGSRASMVVLDELADYVDSFTLTYTLGGDVVTKTYPVSPAISNAEWEQAKADLLKLASIA